MPARKYWGRKTKLKIWFEARVSDMVFSRSRPNAPPMKHESNATGASRAMCIGVSGTLSTNAKSTNGITCMIATRVSPMILPNTLEWRDTGETNTSWAKSFWRSSISDVSPWAVDWNRVIPRKPVNAKPMKLKPADFPRLSWSVPPSRKIIVNGKITAAASRPGSRTNFSRSRPAMAEMAFSSGIFFCQKLDIGVLERRGLCRQHRERLVDRMHHFVRGAAVQSNHEVAVLAERHVERVEPEPQGAAVGRVDVQGLVSEV